MFREENELVATEDDRRLLLELRGKLDLYYTIHIVEHCYLSARRGGQKIIIELKNLDYVDKAALEFLRDSLDVLRWHTGRIRVITTQSWVATDLKSTGVARVCAVEFRNPFKTPGPVGLWSRILHALNPARLLAGFVESPQPLRAVGPSILVR